MTNEELTVLAGLATELANAQRHRDILIDEKRERHYKDEREREERNRFFDEMNRLRESEANALNAEREAICDRDEARKKLYGAARYIDQHYRDLLTAVKTKDCRSIVRNIIASMKDYFSKNKVVYLEGDMAK